AAPPGTSGGRFPLVNFRGILGRRDDLVDEVRRYRVVTRVASHEAAAAAGHGAQVDRVPQDLRRRHARDDLDLTATHRRRSLDPPPLAVEIAHDLALLAPGHPDHELAPP